MDIRLRIVDGGDDGKVYWFKVAALTLAGKPVDRDIFRFPKQTKRVLLNPPPDPLNPPDDWKPKLSVPRECNIFGYDTLADIATRHFLRRQSLIERHVAGLAWTPADWRKTVGIGVPPLPEQDKRHLPFLSDRLATMLGAELLVNAPDVAGELERLEPKPGTVTTISTDFDGSGIPGGGCNDTEPALSFRRLSPTKYTWMRFPLGALPSNVDVTDLDLVLEVTFADATAIFDLQAYHESSGGQTDPSDDTCPTPRVNRSNDDASPYIDNSALIQSAGTKTLQLPTEAETDLEAAKDAVNRFSLAGDATDSPGSEQIVFDSLEAAGTDEPKLTITHAPSAVAQGQTV